MVNVVILGGGELGRHIASILSKERHNIILIDRDAKVLQEISSHLNISTRQGDGTDWQLLDELLEFNPDVFIALTGNDETNIVACTIAKQLHYPRTIAKVRSSRFFNQTRLDFGRIFDVDTFIGPDVLVANDIMKYINSPGSRAVEYFAYGALQLRTLKIPDTWNPPKKSTLKQIKLPENIIVGLIRRETNTEKKIIFPHGSDSILPGDEVTFIGATEAIGEIPNFFGIPQEKIFSVTILGGSIVGQHLTKLLLQNEIDVKIIDNNFEKCRKLAEMYPQSTVIYQDGLNTEFLKLERIDKTDLMVVCTNDDAKNILGCLLGKELGCKQVMLTLNNNSYIPLVRKLGIRYTTSTLNSATNQILAQLLAGKINSLVSLYENEAEVMEINVSLNSKIVGIPLSELGPFLPRDFLIVMIQNRGRIMIAHGNRIISPGDTVIVVTSPTHINELESIF